tara:strand:+ start:11457 stop:12119 length:663 start_codon:yes stop_codon:yes gene_type:complete
MKFNYKDIWNIENAFHFYSNPSRIRKIICHYEIFKKSEKIPGSIVECGVFKGNSFFRFLIFRDLIFNQKKIKKHIYGFDVFGRFPNQKNKKDNKFALDHNKRIGLGLNYNKILNNLKKKKFKNFTLIQGKIEDTAKTFLKKKKNFKISFLHLDLDVYQPTMSALENFYDKISSGGIILIDDYGQVEGATSATNKFLKIRSIKSKIKTLKFDKRLIFIEKK